MQAKRIHYCKEIKSGFHDTLQKRVDELLAQNERRINYFPAVKTIILSISYVFFLTMIFRMNSVPGILVSYATLGVLIIAIFLNIVHDAAHNSLFKNPMWNKAAILLLEVFGTDAYIWKRRHLTSHHAYPNITGFDYDLRQSNVMRILPHSPFLACHRYQHYYMPVLYFFYTLNWLFRRDMMDAFVHASELRVSNNRKMKLIVHKIIYLFSFIILPSLLSVKSIGIYITGFILMHFTASIIGVMALTTSHVNHDSEFPEPDDKGIMPDSWARHQLRVTQDFATNNLFITACFGGFNFHVAHHLFPSVQHVHYKKITDIIRKTAEEFGLEYKSKNLGNALWSHYKLLINNSHRPLEIDM